MIDPTYKKIIIRGLWYALVTIIVYLIVGNVWFKDDPWGAFVVGPFLQFGVAIAVVLAGELWWNRKKSQGSMPQSNGGTYKKAGSAYWLRIWIIIIGLIALYIGFFFLMPYL